MNAYPLDNKEAIDGFAVQDQTEYSDLLRVIQNKPDPKKGSENTTTYDELMRKEARVLDTIDRMIADKHQGDDAKRNVLMVPMWKVPVMIIKTLNDIMNELMVLDEFNSRRVLAIVSQNQRGIYVGMALVIVAVVWMLVGAS